MADATDTEDTRGHRDAKAELDERKIARSVAIGLPLVTVGTALVIGVVIGAPMAILVLAAGLLLGVIALFWASLRILSGDAALSPELEALDASAHAVDALSSRKTMLVRALKDLDNERALGKLDDDDYEQLTNTYRNELKQVMTRIDASLEPHRAKAEDAARSYLAKSGLAEEGYRGTPPRSEPEIPDEDESEPDVDDPESEPEVEVAPKKTTAKAPKKKGDDEPRVPCASCQTSNEVDATFCKKCGASLTAKDDAKPDVKADAGPDVKADVKKKEAASDEA